MKMQDRDFAYRAQPRLRRLLNRLRRRPMATRRLGPRP